MKNETEYSPVKSVIYLLISFILIITIASFFIIKIYYISRLYIEAENDDYMWTGEFCDTYPQIKPEVKKMLTKGYMTLHDRDLVYEMVDKIQNQERSEVKQKLLNRKDLK